MVVNKSELANQISTFPPLQIWNLSTGEIECIYTVMHDKHVLSYFTRSNLKSGTHTYKHIEETTLTHESIAPFFHVITNL